MEMKKMCDQWSNVNNEPLMRAYVVIVYAYCSVRT